MFGTSIPTVVLPGIGAIIRIPSAPRERAMSSSNVLILAILTPDAGVTSYNVTVGPTVAVISVISTPKVESVLRMSSSFANFSDSETEKPPLS